MLFMKYLVVITFFLTLNLKSNIKADDSISPHTMGHIIGGLGSFFLGPLPGLGLSILPEAISMIDNQPNSNNRITFRVNEYSKEYNIQPFIEESEENKITKQINTVKLTNSLNYY